MRQELLGKLHPLTILANDAYKVFSDLGFEIAMGPELETEWYNFDALNMPGDHPARDMQDTFWIKGEKGKVLRTHTTATTIRGIEQAGKDGRIPSAFISIGKVFRNEATDITHEMQFYQIDGIAIGKIEDGISMADLKGVLLKFYKAMLGQDTEVQFRPSFFPFTEPSIEIWVRFKDKWLEMMGGGMINPKVLENAGFDPKKFQGFAFGGGLDRIAMIKWKVPDVRMFYHGDLRLNQF